MPPTLPLTVGVTGGIGSGKSTVCRLLAQHGADVFDADAEAKRLMTEDAALRRRIGAAFGADMYTPEGPLDRARLAAAVFPDPERLAALNALVHPAVYEAFGRRRAATAADVLALEAALLFESGGEAHVDLVVVVDAPEALRLARAAARDAVAPEAVAQRAARQAPPESYRRRADRVIENDGSAEHLAEQTRLLWAWLCARAEARR